MFSFGIVLWALLARKRPYTELEPGVVAAESAKGARPTLPTDCPKRLGDLIERCWDADAAKRPTFNEILSLLDDSSLMSKESNSKAKAGPSNSDDSGVAKTELI